MITVQVRPSYESVGRMFKTIDMGVPMKEGIRTLANMVLGEAKRVTPVDTGRLRGSERISYSKMGLKAIIQPDTTYAVFVHEGTRFMRARPYMEWGLQNALGRAGGDMGHIKNDFDTYLKGQIK